jgi:hypothetical protein
METFLLALEAKREKENAEKSKQVEGKITELTSMIQVKEKEREVHRRSVMMEIGDLKSIPSSFVSLLFQFTTLFPHLAEQMTQISTDSGGKPNLQQAKELEGKMKQMEGALQKMNNVYRAFGCLCFFLFVCLNFPQFLGEGSG